MDFSGESSLNHFGHLTLCCVLYASSSVTKAYQSMERKSEDILLPPFLDKVSFSFLQLSDVINYLNFEIKKFTWEGFFCLITFYYNDFGKIFFDC